MIAAGWQRLEGAAGDVTGLTPAEQARADGFGSERRRRQYLAGRDLLRQVAAGVLNLDARNIALNAEGLPRCLNQAAPLWLSLSHSGPWVAAVASTLGPVGIDVEQRGQRRDWAGLATGLGWTGAEAASPDGFLLRWTHKEALYKAGMDAAETVWQAVSEEAVLTVVAGSAWPLRWLNAGHPDLKRLAVTI